MTALGQIGPFSLAEILGQGGMATVYLAEHPQYGRVALRVIRKDPSKAQTEIVEAERIGAYQHMLLSQFGCPCVPKAYEPYEDSSYFCVPVEYIEGETLARKIESAPLSEAESVRIAISVCKNLQCAHQLKGALKDGRLIDHVVHGDIKPANVMIDSRHEVKVLDYGISKPILDQKIATRQVFGAACYSSPERLANKTFDLHTDLWAVGIMLYEMISSGRPFEGNEVEVRHAFLEGRRPPPLRGASAAYEAVVRKMLSFDRTQRYQSAAEVIADLERCQSGLPPRALTEVRDLDDRTVRAALVTDPGALTTREPARPKVSQASKRWRVVPMMMLGLLAGSIGSGAYVWWHESQLVQEAGEFRLKLERKTEVTLNDWKTYQDLAARSWTGIPTRGPAQIIKQRYEEYASRAIRDYREGLSRALSGQRRQTAEIYLQRVLSLDPSDRQAQSMLLIVQAYGIPLTNEENGRKAIDLFEQAERSDSGSVDPYLGIARASVYSLRDPDRANAAMNEAKKRGYVEVDRDHALMADGYRYKATDLWKSARLVDCKDVDKEVLRKIEDLLKRSIDLYRGIPQFSGTQASLEAARATLDEVRTSCPHSPWWKIWERL